MSPPLRRFAEASLTESPLVEAGESLLQWFHSARRERPTALLSDLIDADLPPVQLIDLACVDLIQQRRDGQPIDVQSYLDAFPSLRKPSFVLDLIDAQLCSARECGEPFDEASMITRFPTLADDIRLLVDLGRSSGDGVAEEHAQRIMILEATADGDDESTGGGSIEISARTPGQDASPPIELPLRIPETFLATQCVLVGKGHWLFRGRHAVTGEALALKVVALPTHRSPTCDAAILDVCETASQPPHPSWVRPLEAVVENHHLGIVRPWCFANAWPSDGRDRAAEKVAKMLHQIATLAMALQSAHDLGATHGAVHLRNVMIDHSGAIRLVDACGSQVGWQRACGSADGQRVTVRDFEQRRLDDVRGLLTLVSGVTFDLWPRPSPVSIAMLADRVSPPCPDGCSRIAEAVLRAADHGVVDDGGASGPPGDPAPRRWWSTSPFFKP